ncbi:hypothetical protein N7495_000916 [Penicillium taxi]|uniref:uncharacterized protein n=1 Tax=Penicillium taxi TaxID=168475 RepID=UPI002545356D|nr:uncharacterized protein N7495_000916 [Penicillium taxi]KAJ5908234.1 hypothetical protein N7495_000916 [Penicillium taxi]
MSPISMIHGRSVNINNPTSTADYFAAQSVNPGDIFSILLLLGPELAGRQITPVAFSFGWVAYVIKALLSAVGGNSLAISKQASFLILTDGKLMPPIENTSMLIIAAESGHSRTTTSWVLGRLLRDISDRLDEEMSVKQPSKPWEALRIAVYGVLDDENIEHRLPERLYLAFRLYVNKEWGTFMVTYYSNILALSEGSLPQWRRSPTIILTKGNGSRFTIVILGKKNIGLGLEILARGTRTAPASLFTRLATSFFALNWIILLILATSLKIDT